MSLKGNPNIIWNTRQMCHDPYLKAQNEAKFITTKQGNNKVWR